jgi:hypothetical protein
MSSVKAEADYFGQEHVHTMADGRGPRRAFIDDIEYTDVTYADTKLGIAVMANQPLRAWPGTEYIDESVVMGDVRVEPKEPAVE